MAHHEPGIVTIPVRIAQMTRPHQLKGHAQRPIISTVTPTRSINDKLCKLPLEQHIIAICMALSGITHQRRLTNARCIVFPKGRFTSLGLSLHPIHPRRSLTVIPAQSMLVLAFVISSITLLARLDQLRIGLLIPQECHHIRRRQLILVPTVLLLRQQRLHLMHQAVG